MAIRTGDPKTDQALRDVQTRLEKLEKAVPFQILDGESVTTGNTTVAHGLGRTPDHVIPAYIVPSTATVAVISKTPTHVVVKASLAAVVTLFVA